MMVTTLAESRMHRREVESSTSLEVAFEEMTPILGGIFRAHGVGSQADDLLAETRRVAIEIQDRREGCHLEPHRWIRVIAYNVMFNYKTKRKPLTGILGRVSDDVHGGGSLPIEETARQVRHGEFVAPADQDTPDERAIKREERQFVWTCLRRVGVREPELRTTLALHLAGIPGVHLAERLGIQYSTGQWRISSGKTQLKEVAASYRDFLAKRGASRRFPWTRAMDRSAQDAWHWIWSLADPEAEVAKLYLFGGVDGPLLQRFEFRASPDQAVLADHQAKMAGAGWN